jgi:hypothetical protein
MRLLILVLPCGLSEVLRQSAVDRRKLESTQAGRSCVEVLGFDFLLSGTGVATPHRTRNERRLVPFGVKPARNQRF